MFCLQSKTLREAQLEKKIKVLQKKLRKARRQAQMLRATSASNEEAAAQLAAAESKVAAYERLLEVMCSAFYFSPTCLLQPTLKSLLFAYIYPVSRAECHVYFLCYDKR